MRRLKRDSAMLSFVKLLSGLPLVKLVSGLLGAEGPEESSLWAFGPGRLSSRSEMRAARSLIDMASRTSSGRASLSSFLSLRGSKASLEDEAGACGTGGSGTAVWASCAWPEPDSALRKLRMWRS